MAADPAQPLIDWINAAPLAELATEVMQAFGPDGVRNREAVSPDALIEWMFRRYPRQAGFIAAARPVDRAIMEAVQILEHCELIYLRSTVNDRPVWSVTRLGIATLVTGKDAIRQRIKDRTKL